MPRLVIQDPSYRHHKASGQAIVTLDGKDIYLGRWDSAASKREYQRHIREWKANGRRLPSAIEPANLAIIDLVARFKREELDQAYHRAGRPTRESLHYKLIFRRLCKLYGETPAHQFSPLCLKALRSELIEDELSRKYINAQVQRIKRLFRWAVENEMVAPSVYQALSAVRGLMKGRSPAREGRKIVPVPDAFIDAIRPFVSKQVEAIIDLQLLTAARPGELCIMRRCDIDETGKCWFYTPATHKTEHHDKERRIHIGPKAQQMLKPFLTPQLTAYLFSPAAAEENRQATRRANRKTPITPSQAVRRRKHKPQCSPGEHYDVPSYRRAIARAMEQAYPPPERLRRHRGEKRKDWRARLGDKQWSELKTWQHEHTWHPHRLRHNAATRLRREFGIEVARVVLGHHSALVTEIYAEQDQALARDAMNRVG